MIEPDGSLTYSTLDWRALVVPGQPAPDFATGDADRKYFRLIQLREKKCALLVFCPEIGSEGCRARLASLQALRTEFARNDVEVLVIGDWTPRALAEVGRRFGPGFSWLHDPGLRITSCYARRARGDRGQPRPMLVLVDKKGKVERAMDDDGGARPHSADLLRWIEKMTAPAAG